MKVLGIIAEYNPFHLGHLYHINRSKQLTGATHTICIMSGNFLQRGEPSIVNKWARAKMALLQGVDLVLELPVCYSVQPAQFFAFGAISSLHLTGIVDYLCFGSESGDLNLLKSIAKILFDEPNEFRYNLKHYLSEGVQFPKAQANALANYIIKYSDLNIDELEILQLINNPNNILGIEYLKAILVLKSPIIPITIKRIKSDYHSYDLSEDIVSAKAIRKLILDSDYKKNLNNISRNVPIETLEILKYEFSKGRGPIVKDDFSQTLLYCLRRASRNDLLKIFDVSEGLENRILRKSHKYGTFSEIVDSIKTKRYTTTRIQRILFNLLINIKRSDITDFYNIGPQYFRVLGFSKKGQELIKRIKETSSVPIITKTSHYKKFDNYYLNKMIEYDIAATDLYSLAYKNPDMRKKGWDFFNDPIII